MENKSLRKKEIENMIRQGLSPKEIRTILPIRGFSTCSLTTIYKIGKELKEKEVVTPITNDIEN